REVQLAVDSHLPIVRLRIEDVTLSDDLRYYLSTPHWLDALSPPLSRHIARLKTAVQELLAQSAEEPAKEAVASELLAAQLAPKKSFATSEQKSPTNRTPLVIAAAVILAAGVAVAIWVLRPERTKESKAVDLAVAFYAAKVDLFEEGWKTTDAIRQDIEGYNARWPNRRATIRGDVKLSEKAANRSYTASFEHDYYVENASRGEWINGA